MRGGSVLKIEVPSEDADLRSELSWLTIQPDDQTPYVLSKRAVDQGWIPPRDHSALPPWVEKQVPDDFQYWKKSGGADRRKVRNGLRDLIKSKKIKMDYDPPGNMVSKAAERFSLQRQAFRGPIVVREGSSLTRWHFTAVNGNRVHFDGEGPNPFESEGSMLLTEKFPWDKMYFEGDAPPGTLHFNETKDTPSKIEVWDKGPATILIDNPDVKKVELKGKKLRGVFLFTRREEGLWSVKLTKAASEAHNE